MSTDIVIAAATVFILLAGIFNGYRRGLSRESAAFVGVLLGMLLVEYWADRWSGWLVGRGFENATARLISEIVLIGAPALGGYGAGLLLRGPFGRRERGFGAALGMLNFALLGALVVRSLQRFGWGELDPSRAVQSWLRSALVTRYVLDYFALALLALGGALMLLGLGAAISRLVRLLARRRSAAPPRSTARPAQPAPGGAPSVAPAQQPTPPQSQRLPPGQQEKFLE